MSTLGRMRHCRNKDSTESSSSGCCCWDGIIMAADETESPSNEDVTDDPSSSTGLGPIGSTSVKDVEAVAGDRAATFLRFRLNHRRGGLLLELLISADEIIRRRTPKYNLSIHKSGSHAHQLFHLVPFLSPRFHSLGRPLLPSSRCLQWLLPLFPQS